MALFLAERQHAVDELNDGALRDLAAIVMALADWCAREHYCDLIDPAVLTTQSPPEREALRLVVGAVIFLGLSVISAVAITSLGLPSELYVVSFGTCFVVSVAVVFGPLALAKIEQLGIFGR